MQLLLITTSPNAVRQMLENRDGISLTVIDCTDYARGDTKAMRDSLQQAVEQCLQQFIPDLLITYRCPFVIPCHLFSKARMGAYNIHPSLLPKYRGLNPWKAMFRNGEREGGVTIHRLANEADAGETIVQKAFEIESSDTIETARQKADTLATEMLSQLLVRFL